jgi:UDP-N-acetylglucosamine 4,6-dehydratase
VVPAFRALRATGKLPIRCAHDPFWIALEQGVELVLSGLDLMAGGAVPKIPSMKILDLADVLAPGCENNSSVFVRERSCMRVLVPADESRRTLEFSDKYVICPDDPHWKNEKLNAGKKVSEDFPTQAIPTAGGSTLKT